MSYATTADGVRLYTEETGSGTPIVFVHEFGDNYHSWDHQVEFFSRRYRCITFAARGYPPSDVPQNVDAYSQALAMQDILAVMDHHEVPRAHVIGCSMGGFAALHFGLNHPDRALSLVAAGAGYGAEKAHEQYFRDVSNQVAERFETLGSKAFSSIYGSGASRVQYQNKNPAGWQRFIARLAQHDSRGAANTMRGVQARRPSLYDLEAGFRNMAVPTLIVVGDEDDHCLQPGIFLKRTIPASGLMVVPKSGHAVNLEEPTVFNQAVAEFLAMVEAGRWAPRDPRARAEQIMQVGAP
ncbi:alpha/beta hydrolase [Roseiarcaceae bacterium H3SJ34-1]|uniref:alpha/beta fold hydrolase n=1 Tax=Terripilifer ovatus TaxID=3032367 RepID=UPI003AB94277|nr:alpha/beta hydrolase [Roseiarcaceae bacterium H3SJ34-1]